MIDKLALDTAVSDLIKNFPTHWKNEKYKWEAVKWFQDNWNIDATNFSEMFSKATEKTYNLLHSSMFFPGPAITNWSKKDPELFRKMFKNLYDETKDLKERVKNFITTASEYHKNLNDGGANHYQNTNAVSVYLWLKYPDKYYIYKYTEARAIAHFLKYPDIPKKSSDPAEMIKAFKMYDEIKNEIKSNKELTNLLKQSLTPTCYSDPDYTTLAFDVGFYISRKEDITTESETIIQKEEQQLESQENHHLNQILYGPPGTGKTYNTIKYSIAIIEQKNIKDINEENYEDVRKRFNDYKKSGQIEFITFHQSYSYEEFVEGIKPEEPEDDDTGITYSCQPGIFKDICKKAGTRGNFEECYKKFLEDISETEKYKLKTPTNKEYAVSIRQNGSLKFYTGKDLRKGGSLTKEKIRNAYLNILPDYYRGYYQGVVEELRKKYGLNQGDNKKTYVLIIDEINRGNISKIFGELITLIEEDKREKLSVRLPYSKEEFIVPKNLSIIGTMNTADRSIAAIDIALRRRFKFIEMMPNANLKELDKEIDGINLSKLMSGLNKRITVLLDRDHQIGHAYFMKINDVFELKDAWFNKILPLLNEYFYSDWSKLKLLVKDFVKEELIPEDLKDEYGDEKIYSFIEEEKISTETFINILKKLY